MENTLENKRKFASLYFGQEVLSFPFNKVQEGNLFNLNHVMNQIIEDSQYSVLNLKPLSSITEKDFIHLVEISMPYLKAPEFKISKGYNKNGHNIDGSVLCLEIIEYIDLIDQEVLHALIQIDTDENDIITGMFEDDGKILRDDATDNIIHVINFLRSKGYALPWMGVSVEKQVEYGWVKIIE